MKNLFITAILLVTCNIAMAQYYYEKPEPRVPKPPKVNIDSLNAIENLKLAGTHISDFGKGRATAQVLSIIGATTVLLGAYVQRVNVARRYEDDNTGNTIAVLGGGLILAGGIVSLSINHHLIQGGQHLNKAATQLSAKFKF